MRSVLVLFFCICLVLSRQVVAQNADNNRVYSYKDTGLKEPAFTNGESELNRFLALNLRYPAQALAEGATGLVVTSFIVQVDGRIDSIKVEKSAGYGLDEEAIRVLKLTNGKWQPSQLNGQAVKFRRILPIRFSLNSGASSPGKAADTFGSNNAEIIKPKRAATANGTDPRELNHLIDLSKDSTASDNPLVDYAYYIKGRQALADFITSNKRYPVFASNFGLYGEVRTSFIIMPDGKIDSIKVLKGPGFGLHEEVVRVMKLTAGKWKPGRINGENSYTRITMPIWFNMNGSKLYTEASLELLDKEFEAYKKTDIFKLEQEGKFDEARKLARKLNIQDSFKKTEIQVRQKEKEYTELMEKAKKTGLIDFAIAANKYYNEGITAFEQGKLEEAKNLFTTALELKADHFPALQNRGVTKYKLNDKKGACEDWQQMVKMGETLPEFLVKLCQ